MIFTERTIMVVNDSATINKPLILYRGDKNIELKITIAESQFKFRNNDASNVIETTDASYAQLVINTPYNSPIFSEVAATKNGTVIFVISEAMIDEIREVGIYDIQIRLLDDNKQSRVTIPPVSNAIEIREPMAIEDGSVVDSNAVNVAKVNRALTTTSAPLEAFDSQGNYIKTTWGEGDVITDAKLNKIEAGIEGVNNKVVTKTSQLTNDANYASETFVTNKIAEAQLGGGEVDLSGYVTKGTGNASQITFSDGETFQTKLDSGALKGDKGDKGDIGATGPQGLKGDKGDTGERGPQGIQGIQGPSGANGQDGLTTAVSVNGSSYTHIDGTITLPNYPTIPTNVSAFTNDSNYASETYVTNAIANAQLGGGNTEIDLSGYVTKELGNASQITFSDGETFQTKLDSGALKGDKGDKGDIGATGLQGERGPQGIQGERGPAGADGYTPVKGVDYFDGAKGDKGDKGDTGEQGPQGLKGDKGDTGERGPQGEQGIQGLPGEKGEKGERGEQGIQGVQGADGQTPNITIGTVTTLNAGSNATAEITGATPNLTLNLGIPKGDKGDKGDTGSGGTASSTDIKPLVNSTSNVQKSQYNAKPIRPLISFTDDDGKAGVYTKWLPILQEKNIPMSLCIITSQIGKPGYLTWSQIQELQNTYGCEILSHTVTHGNINTHQTNKTWIEELKQSKNDLMEHGLNVRGFAYPNGGFWGTKEGLVDGTSNGHWMTGLFYDYGITTGSTMNTHPITTNMGIDRAGIGSYAADGRFDTLDNIKARVDECYAQNGWLIFMTHVDDAAHTDEDNQMLRDLIDYINAKGIDIVTISEGFEIFGNAVETPNCKITKQGNANINLTTSMDMATTDKAGAVIIGQGLSVSEGVVSVDSALYYSKSYIDTVLDNYEVRIAALESGSSSGGGGGGDTSSNPVIGNIAAITASPGNPFDIVYTVTDGDGIRSHELSLDNGVEYNAITPTSNGDTYTYNTSIASEGVYYCKLRVTDTLGNMAIRSFSITVQSSKIYLNYAKENNVTVVDENNGIFQIEQTSGKYDALFLFDTGGRLELNKSYTLHFEMIENTLTNTSIFGVGTTWSVTQSGDIFGGITNLSPGQSLDIPFTIYEIPNSKSKRLLFVQLSFKDNETITGHIKFRVYVLA